MSKRHKQVKMFSLVKEYLSSDKTQVDFCGSHGVKVHNFQYWLSRYKREHAAVQNERQNHKFIPVQINEDQKTDKHHLRISYPSGLTIELPIF